MADREKTTRTGTEVEELSWCCKTFYARFYRSRVQFFAYDNREMAGERGVGRKADSYELLGVFTTPSKKKEWLKGGAMQR